MSKFLLKLLDEAILPSLLMVFARIGGLVAAIIIFELDFEIQAASTQLIPYSLVFSTTYDATLANSISTLLTVAVPTLGLTYALYKVYYYQDQRITPKKLLELADRNLLSFIETSLNAYLKAFVWTIFLWIGTGLALFSTTKQLTYGWITAISIAAAIVLTLLLVKNLEIDYTKVNKEIKSEI